MYFDLGSRSRPTSTASPEAQRWFDRGFVCCYGFNHDEAVRCFEHALEHDPDLALAHWGIAYAVGPNYNKPWEDFDAREIDETLDRARRALDRALALVDGTTGV